MGLDELSDSATSPFARVGLGSGSPRAERRFAQALLDLLRREPLLQFGLIGAALFMADAFLHPPAKDERVIVVTKAMRQSIIETFDEDKERAPTEAELRQKIDNWVANEILFREGKALGVDRGDDTIRDRIVYKLQVLISDQISTPQPTDEQLRAWFERNHARFDEPERVGFYFTPPSDEASARKRLEEIKGQQESEELQQETRAALARPVDSVAASFGPEFRDALLESPLGQWTVLRSKEGWRVVRLDSRHPGQAAKFEDHRDEIARFWRAEETSKQAWDAVSRLKASYIVRYEQ